MLPSDLQNNSHHLNAASLLERCQPIFRRAHTETELLEGICALLVEIGYAFSWIGEKEYGPDARVRLIAQAACPACYLDDLRVAWDDGPFGQGPTGCAIRTGLPGVMRNVAADLHYTPWYDIARRCGYSSSIALPLKLNGVVHGALNIYAAATDAFGDDEIAILTRVSEEVSRAWEQHRRLRQSGSTPAITAITPGSPSTRRLEPELYHTVYEHLQELMFLFELLVGDNGDVTDLIIQESNARARQMLGLSREMIMGQRASAILDSELFSLLRQKSREVLDGGQPSSFELHFPVFQQDYFGTLFAVSDNLFAVSLLEITERKRAETKLLQSESRFRQFFETSRDGQVITDMQFRFIDCNQAFLNLLGVESLTELRRYSYRDITPPEYYEFEERHFHETTLVRGYSDEYEKEYLRPSGERVQVSIRAWLHMDAFGRPQGVWATVRNISGRKRAEAALKASEQRYRLLFELAPVAISIEVGGRIVTLNAEAVRMLGGRSADEFTGTSIFDLLIPGQAASAQAALEALVEGEADLDPMTFELLRKTGERFAANLIAAKISYGGQEAIMIVGTDVTREQQTQQSLAASEKRYREIVETVNEGIWKVDPKGETTFVNAQMASMLGYSVAEMQGRSLLEFVNEADHHELQSSIEQHKSDRGMRFDYCHRRRDGTPLWVSVSARPQFDAEGRFIGVLGIFADISLRVQAEEELRQSRDELRVLAGRLADGNEGERRRIARELHDQVGQELSAIGMKLALIRERNTAVHADSPNRLLTETLEQVEQVGATIRGVIDDLRPVLLDDYGVAVALEWYGQRVAQRSGFLLRMHQEPPLPRLDAEMETALFRIAQEALHNIEKHARASLVVIDFLRQDDRWQMRIEDDGIGFTLSEHPALQESHWGLINMRERALAIGAAFRPESTPGRGTRIVIEWGGERR